MHPSRAEFHVPYGGHPHQRMDVYFPEGYTDVSPVAFVIHGGGFIAGLKEDFSTQAKAMRDAGFVTVNLSHRLVDAAGIFTGRPQHRTASVKITDQLADVDAAVHQYIAQAAAWGAGTGRMYMAGHSAGAILAMLYVQGERNKDGLVRASGNWAGATDLSLTAHTGYNFLPPAQRAQLQELYLRAVGIEPSMVEELSLKVISPYQVAEQQGGRPNISIYPEQNNVLRYPGEAIIGLQNTRKFHALLHSRGIPEQLHVYAGTDHGFHGPGAWNRCIRDTAAFFNAV